MAHLLADSGPEGMENKAKLQPNHLNFAEHHHGPSQEAQRSSLTKKWARLGSVAVRPHHWWVRTAIGPFWPHFWQVASHRRCNNGYVGAWPGSTYLEVRLHFP